MKRLTLTSIQGVQVGHATHPDKFTGTTLVLFDQVYPVSYVSHGGAPGTIATENLHNLKSFGTRDGIFVSGGSMNGLMVDATIRRELIQQKRGLKTGGTFMPVLTGAIVWDLGVRAGQFDPEYGAEALANLSSAPVEDGNFGAGTGTSVGKFQWHDKGTKMAGMKSGVGSAGIKVGDGGMICALSVVNALGNVINTDGTIIAGNRSDQGKGFLEFDETIDFATSPSTNTTITIVGTNIDLGNREAYEKIAHLANQGQVRAINPVNTSIDGDTVFVFSTQEKPSSVLLNKYGKLFQTPDWPDFSIDILGHVAAKVVQESIYQACLSSKSIKFPEAFQGIIPSAKDYHNKQLV